MARTMSMTGMPSVMATMSRMPASTASRMASAAKGGGTKIIVASAPVFSTASATVSNTGTPSIVWPPRPGVTPPTICVPYSRQCFVWNWPALPVIPWHSTRVLRSTRMLMVPPFRHASRRGDDLFRGVGQVGPGDDVQPAFGEDAAALLGLGPFQPHDQGDGETHRAAGFDQRIGDRCAAHDAAEDVDQHRPDARIAGQHAEGFGDLLDVGAAADVEEVGRLAAVELDQVHGAHGQAGPVDQAADIAVELDVAEPCFAGPDLGRLLFGQVAEAGQLGMPEQGVVVEAHLGVQGDELVVGGQHQRVDFQEAAIVLKEDAAERRP